MSSPFQRNRQRKRKRKKQSTVVIYARSVSHSARRYLKAEIVKTGKKKGRKSGRTLSGPTRLLFTFLRDGPNLVSHTWTEEPKDRVGGGRRDTSLSLHRFSLPPLLFSLLLETITLRVYLPTHERTAQGPWRYISFNQQPPIQRQIVPASVIVWSRRARERGRDCVLTEQQDLHTQETQRTLAKGVNIQCSTTNPLSHPHIISRRLHARDELEA